MRRLCRLLSRLFPDRAGGPPAARSSSAGLQILSSQLWRDSCLSHARPALFVGHLSLRDAAGSRTAPCSHSNNRSVVLVFPYPPPKIDYHFPDVSLLSEKPGLK